MPLLSLFSNFPNRLGRAQWWLGMAAIGAIMFAAYALGHQNAVMMVAAALVSLAIFIPVTMARLQDRNRSVETVLSCLMGFAIVAKIFSRILDADTKWSILMGFGCAFVAWVVIELGVLRGTVGPNPYGDDPLDDTGGIKRTPSEAKDIP